MKWRWVLVCLVGLIVPGWMLSSSAAIRTEKTAPEIKTLTFQQGVDGYTGTVDVEIWALSPHTCLEGNPNATSDADNDGGESQILMRFDEIIGHSSGQIPPGATIHSAKLIVSAFDQGNTVHLHRMLVPWKRSVTWNALVAGVTADGLEASRQKDSFTFGKISASSSEVSAGLGQWRSQLWLGVHQHRPQRLGFLHLRIRATVRTATAGSTLFDL